MGSARDDRFGHPAGDAASQEEIIISSRERGVPDGGLTTPAAAVRSGARPGRCCSAGKFTRGDVPTTTMVVEHRQPSSLTRDGMMRPYRQVPSSANKSTDGGHEPLRAGCDSAFRSEHGREAPGGRPWRIRPAVRFRMARARTKSGGPRRKKAAGRVEDALTILPRPARISRTTSSVAGSDRTCAAFGRVAPIRRR